MSYNYKYSYEYTFNSNDGCQATFNEYDESGNTFQDSDLNQASTRFNNLFIGNQNQDHFVEDLDTAKIQFCGLTLSPNDIKNQKLKYIV